VALATDEGRARSGERQVVVVVGPGRSGTSTVAGALCRCGLEVPGRAIRGNATNPEGFYEPRWVVDFHRSILKAQQVDTIDTMPGAERRVMTAAAKPADRDTLRTWLDERLTEQPRLVVKDPRTVWFCDLWGETARELGADVGYVTMLRHPAEVAVSRQRAYSSEEDTRDKVIRRVGGWINVILTAERSSAGSPRAFVRYADLLADWRTALAPVESRLGLTFEPGLDLPDHPVDDFIKPSLHRVQVEWDAVGVPAHLRDLAERVWLSVSALADRDDDGARAEVASLREEYLTLVADSEALIRPGSRRRTAAARARGRRQARKELADRQPSQRLSLRGVAGRARRRFGGGS
jgi:hypothetical protein